MNKEFRIGTLDTGRRRRAIVTVHVNTSPIVNGERLSITADARRPGASDIDQGGQMVDALTSPAFTPAYNWRTADVAQLVDVWQRWHLNDLRAGCEHQRALGWTYDQHPAEPCPTCGYRFGTAWLFEPLPAEILAYLETLPTA